MIDAPSNVTALSIQLSTACYSQVEKIWPFQAVFPVWNFAHDFYGNPLEREEVSFYRQVWTQEVVFVVYPICLNDVGANSLASPMEALLLWQFTDCILYKNTRTEIWFRQMQRSGIPNSCRYISCSICIRLQRIALISQDKCGF